MTPFLQFSISLVVIIVAAKIGGYISYRLRQPSVMGELLAGLLLGPSIIDFLHWPYFTDGHLTETIHGMAEVGVLLLMFIAGLDLHITDLTRSGKVAALAGGLGVVFPLLLGIGVGVGFSMDLASSIFLGLVLSATSVSISAQTLMELKVLRSRVGITLLGAAVFDDVLVVLGLSIFAVVLNTGLENGLLSIFWVILRMFLYLAGATFLGLWLLPKISAKVESLPISRGLTAFTFVVILLYAWTAEILGGMAALTGAFLAGVILSQSQVKERIETRIATLAYGVFVPIFFVNVGLSANARELTGGSGLLFLALLLVAVIGKVFGCGLGANLTGFSRLESIQLGAGMMSRGEVGLIVASVGIAEGWIGQEIFAAVVGMVIVTTLLTPPSLRYLFSRDKSPEMRKKVIQEGGNG